MNARYYIRKWIQHDPTRYSRLHADLVSVRAGLTLEQFLWQSIKIAFLVGFLFALLGFFVSTFLTLQSQTGKVGIYNVFNIQVPLVLSTYHRHRIYSDFCSHRIVRPGNVYRIHPSFKDPWYQKRKPGNQNQPYPS